MFWGKVIGAILGFILGGPAGLVLGLLAGHYFDQHIHLSGPMGAFGTHRARVAEAQRIFFETTFLVMGHIAKADGRVSEKEIHIARSVMQRLLLTPAQKNRAIELFNLGKQPHFDLHAALQRLKQGCYQQTILMQAFIEIQIQAANADGIGPEKRRILENICKNLGFSANFSQFGFGQQQQSYQRQQYQQQGSRRTASQPAADDPYAVLGMSPSASNAELKRAYRKLMSQHHPDKLISKGLPEEMMKLATERAQNIQKAYETIKSMRGI